MFIEDTFAEFSLKGSSVRVVTATGNLLNGMTFFLNQTQHFHSPDVTFLFYSITDFLI